MSSFHTFFHSLIADKTIPTINFLVYVRHPNGVGYGRNLQIAPDVDCTLFDTLRNSVENGAQVKLSSSYGTIVLQYNESGWIVARHWIR